MIFFRNDIVILEMKIFENANALSFCFEISTWGIL
nr:MAG TPA: hypothetical protein [Caudoviricetes sp.]